MAPPSLSETDLKILEIESQTWKLRGSKEQFVRDELGMRWTDYYLRLSRLIETEAAEAHNPILVHRLRRLRDQTIAKKRRGAEPRGST